MWGKVLVCSGLRVVVKRSRHEGSGVLEVLGACGVGLISSFFQLFSFLLLWFCGWDLVALGLSNAVLLTGIL